MGYAVKQRLLFLGMCIITAIGTHYLYQLLKPQWIIYRQADESYEHKNWAQAASLFEESFKKGLTLPSAQLRLPVLIVNCITIPKLLKSMNRTWPSTPKKLGFEKFMRAT